MAKIFVHLARRRAKPALRPLILEPEDPERRRARVAAERREAERIEAARLSRMAERRTQRLAYEAELDAIEETAVSLFPWEILWSRLAAAGRPQTSFKPLNRRPYTNLALMWAAFVIYGKHPSIERNDPVLKACCPVNIDLERTELLIEFAVRCLSLKQSFDTGGFREDARASAAKWTEIRKATRQEWGSTPGVIIEDFGDGWIAASLDVNQTLFLEPSHERRAG